MRRMVRGEQSSFGQVDSALSDTSASCRPAGEPARVRQPGNAAAALAAGAFRFNQENPAGHRHSLMLRCTGVRWRLHFVCACADLRRTWFICPASCFASNHHGGNIPILSCAWRRHGHLCPQWHSTGAGGREIYRHQSTDSVIHDRIFTGRSGLFF